MIQTIDVALSQIGVREATGANDGIPAMRYMDGDKLPWCAGLLLWCNASSDDTKVARSNRDRYDLRAVQELEGAFKDRGWWLPPDTKPQRNDFMFLVTRGASDKGPGRHVEIVESLDGDVLWTVGGNVSNACDRHKWRLPYSKVTGWGRLPEVPKEEPKPEPPKTTFKQKPKNLPKLTESLE